MSMMNYTTIGSNKLPEALAFYDDLLGTLGWKKVFERTAGGRFYGKPGVSWFGVLAPANGEQATIGNGSMVGFAVDSPEAVHAFHAKALELGGTDEGAPGPRGAESSGATFGYFRDLDGNKLCAYHFGTSAR